MRALGLTAAARVSAVDSHLSDGTPTEYLGTHSLGTVIVCNVAGEIVALRYYETSSMSGTVTLRLYIDGTSTEVRSVTHTATAGLSGWRDVPITPYAVTAGQVVMPTYHTDSNGNYYAAISSRFNTAQTNADGSLTGAQSGSVSLNGYTGNGRYGTALTMPTSTFSANDYCADLVLRH